MIVIRRQVNPSESYRYSNNVTHVYRADGRWVTTLKATRKFDSRELAVKNMEGYVPATDEPAWEILEINESLDKISPSIYTEVNERRENVIQALTTELQNTGHEAIDIGDDSYNSGSSVDGLKIKLGVITTVRSTGNGNHCNGLRIRYQVNKDVYGGYNEPKSGI